jgi:hypothetical protein
LIFVWVRRTVEWQDERAFRAQLDPRFEPHVERWNETFDLPFHLFRHRVREVARESLANARGITIAEWDAIPDGAVVIPIDDDDWLAPDVGPALEAQLAPDVRGWRWRASFVEVPFGPGHQLYLWRRRLFPWTPEKWYCSTNNYALRKGSATPAIFERHLEASRLFDTWRRAGSVRAFDRPLSAHNRTLGSQTSLRYQQPPRSRPELRRRYGLYRRLYDRRLPADLDWCAPYVEKMGRLMADMSIKP